MRTLRFFLFIGLLFISGRAALALVSIGETDEAPPGIRYCRIDIAPATAVYVQFAGKQMRFATSSEGLAKTKPLQATQTQKLDGDWGTTIVAHFPEVVLPTGNAKLAIGKPQLKAVFHNKHYAPRRAPPGGTPAEGYDFVDIDFTLRHLAEDGTVWEYRWTVAPGTSENIPTNASPPISLTPRLQPRIKLVVLSGGDLRVAVQVPISYTNLSDVKHDGTDVPVALTVIQADGNLPIATEIRNLPKFGFG
jgi:hypothetical protein